MKMMTIYIAASNGIFIEVNVPEARAYSKKALPRPNLSYEVLTSAYQIQTKDGLLIKRPKDCDPLPLPPSFDIRRGRLVYGYRKSHTMGDDGTTQAIDVSTAVKYMLGVTDGVNSIPEFHKMTENYIVV